MLTILTDFIPALSADNSSDEMRALAEQRIADPRLRLAVVTLIDEVEITRYSKDGTADPKALQRIKLRLQELLTLGNNDRELR